jgi:Tfp pilus assembly protein PilN
MPKIKSNPLLDINLLKPQGESQKILVQLVRWMLSAGRYLIIFVEIIVLGAFLIRFTLDTEIADNKDSINQQLPFVKALKQDETLIRQTQFQLHSLQTLRAGQPDYVALLARISNQTPDGITITSLNIQNNSGKLILKINGTAQNNDQIATLIYGLRSDSAFSGVNLDAVNLDQGVVNFDISLTEVLGGKI